jgi:hypothetical protein
MKATLSVAAILLSCVVSFPAASQSVPSTDSEEVRILELEAAWNRAEQQKRYAGARFIAGGFDVVY